MSAQPPEPFNEQHDDLLGQLCSEVIDGLASADEREALLAGIEQIPGGRRELLLHLLLDTQLRSLLRGEDDSPDQLSA